MINQWDILCLEKGHLKVWRGVAKYKHKNIERNMQRIENKNLPVGNRSTKEIENSKKQDTRLITTPTQEEKQLVNESQMNRVEVLRSPEDIVSQGVLESMNIIDSSANVLHSQMTSLIKSVDQNGRKSGDLMVTQQVIQCGNAIGGLIKTKIEALKLLSGK